MLPMSKSLMRDVCRVHGIAVEPNESGARMLRKFLYMDEMADTKSVSPPVSSVLCEDTWRKEQLDIAHERRVAVSDEELDRRWKLILSRKTNADDVMMDTDLYDSLSSDEKQSLTLVVRTRTSCYLRPCNTEAPTVTDKDDSQEQAEARAAIKAVEDFHDSSATADKVPDAEVDKPTVLDVPAKEKMDDATADDATADDAAADDAAADDATADDATADDGGGAMGGQYKLGDMRLRADGCTEIFCTRQIVRDGIPWKGTESCWMLKTEYDAAQSTADDADELVAGSIDADDADTPAEGVTETSAEDNHTPPVADESERPAKKARVEKDEGDD